MPKRKRGRHRRLAGRGGGAAVAVRVPPPGGRPPEPRASGRVAGITRVSSGRCADVTGTCWVASPDGLCAVPP